MTIIALQRFLVTSLSKIVKTLLRCRRHKLSVCQASLIGTFVIPHLAVIKLLLLERDKYFLTLTPRVHVLHTDAVTLLALALGVLALITICTIVLKHYLQQKKTHVGSWTRDLLASGRNHYTERRK